MTHEETIKRIQETIYKIKVSIYELQCIDGYESNSDLTSTYDRICDFQKSYFNDQSEETKSFIGGLLGK